MIQQKRLALTYGLHNSRLPNILQCTGCYVTAEQNTDYKVLNTIIRQPIRGLMYEARVMLPKVVLLSAGVIIKCECVTVSGKEIMVPNKHLLTSKNNILPEVGLLDYPIAISKANFHLPLTASPTLITNNLYCSKYY